MKKVTGIQPEFELFKTRVDKIFEEAPDIREGILFVFDGNGCVEVMYNASASQLAIAACRLVSLANDDES